MPLTAEQREYWLQVLKDTGGNRETMLKEAVIPQDYLAYGERIERREMTLSLPGITVPVRVVVSFAKERQSLCPIHVNFHGGGFIFPQNEDDDMYCARIAAGIGGIVVDVDYALSPDYPFPTAFEQCYEVTRWAFSKCQEWDADEKRVSVGGQSAGGALAAAVALRATASGDFKLCLAVLGYAALDMVTPAGDKPDSRGTPEGLLKRSEALNALYSGGSKYVLRMPFASPAFATDNMLKGMPETVFLTGGRCPFRFEDETLARRMAAQGVTVTVKRYLNSRHGFAVRRLDQWQEAQAFTVRAIRRTSL